MTHPRPSPELPLELLARPCSTRELRAAGVTPHQLAGPLWRQVHRGVHIWMGAGPPDPTQRIAAVVAGLPPGVALGGWAALHHLGLAVVDGRRGPDAGVDVPITVCTGPVGRLEPRSGIDVDRSTILDVDLVEHRGVLVTRPARSCLDVARRFGAEEGLVVTDAALRARLVSRSDLDDALSRLVRIKAVPTARMVVALSDPRAESPAESRLRYVWIVEAELPVPLANPRVHDLRGVFLGRVDLLGEEAGLVGEYDGAEHRDLRRHTADNAREEDLEATNLVVTRVTAVDLWPQRRRLIARLRARHAQGLARDRSRDAWVFTLP